MGASHYGGFGMTEKQAKRLSFGQQLVLWSLSGEPMTALELSVALKCTKSCIHGLLRQLKPQGLVYVAGIQAKYGQQAPVYSVHTKHAKPQRAYIQQGVDATSREMVTTAIREMGPMTAVEIADHLDVPRNRVNSTLTHHRNGGRSSKVFRVANWVWIDRRGWVPAYGLGPAADADKPKPNKQENQARYRERMKSVFRSKTKTFAGNPFGELIHMAGATHQAAYWNRVAS